MAILWALTIRIGLALGDTGLALVFMGVAGIFINTVLMVLNLLPLPPLDGGRVMTGLLPGPLAYKFSRIEPYGFFILQPYRALRVLHTGRVAGHGTAGRDPVAGDRVFHQPDGRHIRPATPHLYGGFDGAAG
jgi:hypothetical protein